MYHQHTNRLFCLVGLGLLFTTGCSTSNILDSTLLGDSFSSSLRSIKQKISKKESNPIAVRCDIRWQARKGPKLNGLPGRGFGGQINFYTPGSPEPVKVDGDVRIYVFDDQGTPEENVIPIHQFDFSAKTFNAYLAETKIGKTYGIFIPYTKPGNRQANVSLKLRMIPQKGPMIFSDMVTIQLPGTKPKSKSKKQYAGLNAKEINLNRSDSIQTAVDSHRSHADSQLNRLIQKARSQQPATRTVTSDLATRKLVQLFNEQLKNGEMTKIEKPHSTTTPVAEKNPLELLPDSESTTLPNQSPKSASAKTARKRFRLSPAQGANVVKSQPVEAVRILQQPIIKTESPSPPLSLPVQSNEWHSFDE